MSVTVDVTAEHIARRIASTIDPVFAMIDGWRDVLERELSGPLAGALTGSTEPTAETLDPVVAALVQRRARARRHAHHGCGLRRRARVPRRRAVAPRVVAERLEHVRRRARPEAPPARGRERPRLRAVPRLHDARVVARPGPHGHPAPHRPVRRLPLHRRLHGDDHDARAGRGRDGRARGHRPVRRAPRAGAAAGDPRVGASVHPRERVGPHRRLDRCAASDRCAAAPRRARRGARAAARGRCRSRMPRACPAARRSCRAATRRSRSCSRPEPASARPRLGGADGFGWNRGRQARSSPSDEHAGSPRDRRRPTRRRATSARRART